MIRSLLIPLICVASMAADCRTATRADATLDAGARPFTGPFPTPLTVAITPVPDSASRWRGMTFAHEGYDGVRGYGGQATHASLDSLASFGVDALSIVPYTFMRSPNQPAPLPIPTQLGSETDSAVVATIRLTHAHGWRVLLKPQIWLHDSWPGDIDFDTPQDWTRFLEHYRTWILHYADLAAQEQVAALCIGTELTHATLKHPGFWRKLIQEIRGRYSGDLTYAANWGTEFEEITFWNELDAVGLDAYYPLSPKPAATDAELLAGAREWMRMADTVSARADRPLWLTEVGYRSVKAAWQNPHADPGSRVAAPLDQARCYRALALAAAESQRITGLFVWKWPSYLYKDVEATGLERYWMEDQQTTFAPAHPAAAKALRDIYRNL